MNFKSDVSGSGGSNLRISFNDSWICSARLGLFHFSELICNEFDAKNLKKEQIISFFNQNDLFYWKMKKT